MGDKTGDGFVKYLERAQSVLLLCFADKPYSELLKEATGFGFSKQKYYSKDGKGVFYKLENELKEADVYYANLITNKDPKINEWLNKEKETHLWAKNLSVDMNPKEVFETIEQIILYNTVIPYRLLTAYEKATPNPELLKKLEKVRSTSLYPTIMYDFIPKFLEKFENTEEMFLCTPEEIIMGKFDIESIRKRKDGCYFWREEEWKFSYASTDKYASKVDGVNEVKGLIAFKGKVKGTVKIVNSHEDMKDFKEGNVLISINTNPTLMPVLKICSAIVSDEGGITSHAAIVSRELKKPCITGTKIATKVFRDGDMVEVDANKGIVKKIK